MPSSRARSSARQSDIFDPRDPAHGRREVLPRIALRREDAPALARQAIEPAPPLARALDPAALQPAPRFEPVQQRVQGRHLEPDLTARAFVDEAADLVAMAGAMLDQRQDHELRAALLELPVEAQEAHMLHSDMLH